MPFLDLTTLGLSSLDVVVVAAVVALAGGMLVRRFAPGRGGRELPSSSTVRVGRRLERNLSRARARRS